MPELVEQGIDASSIQTDTRAKTELAVPLTAQKTEYHQAYLLGGTKQLVTNFATRCQQRGIPIEVKKLSSRSKSGKMIHWYQARTSRYTDQTELLALVDAIKKVEHIKDITLNRYSE